MSWYSPKNIWDILKTDTNKLKSDDKILNNDFTKIYSHNISLGIWQADDLRWIEHICSASEREELYDKIQIISAFYYPKSCRVDTFEELMHKLTLH
jgi:hypothetical protein